MLKTLEDNIIYLNHFIIQFYTELRIFKGKNTAIDTNKLKIWEKEVLSRLGWTQDWEKNPKHNE